MAKPQVKLKNTRETKVQAIITQENFLTEKEYCTSIDNLIIFQDLTRELLPGSRKKKNKEMSMDAPIDLVEQFKALSQEKQEMAISYIAAFEAKAEPSALEQLKKDYIKFPKNQKITVDTVLAHLKPQLKDYVASFGAKEDSIYLDDLREIEPLTTKMYQAFYRAHKKDNSSPLLGGLIPKKTKKIDSQIEHFEPTRSTSIQEYYRLTTAKSRRKKVQHKGNREQTAMEIS